MGSKTVRNTCKKCDFNRIQLFWTPFCILCSSLFIWSTAFFMTHQKVQNHERIILTLVSEPESVYLAWKTGYFRNRTRPKCGINPLFQGFENGSIKNTKEIWTELERNTLKPTSAFFQRPTAKSGRFYAF